MLLLNNNLPEYNLKHLQETELGLEERSARTVRGLNRLNFLFL